MFYSLWKFLSFSLNRLFVCFSLVGLGLLGGFFSCFFCLCGLRFYVGWLFLILNHQCLPWLAHSQISIKAPGGTLLSQMWFVPTEAKVWCFCFPVQEWSLLLPWWSLKPAEQSIVITIWEYPPLTYSTAFSSLLSSSPEFVFCSHGDSLPCILAKETKVP